jgi:hypothetical protein
VSTSEPTVTVPARLFASLEKTLRLVLAIDGDTVTACHGDKCRLSTCESCSGDYAYDAAEAGQQAVANALLVLKEVEALGLPPTEDAFTSPS